MKKYYIQPQTEAQMVQNLHVVCGSPEPDITYTNEGGDPNVLEAY